MKLRAIAAAAALAVASTPASAVIVSITLSGPGTSSIISAPTNLSGLTGNTIYGFTERQNFTIAGTPPFPTGLFAPGFTSSGSVKPVGGLPNSSTFFVFNPGLPGSNTISGTITFAQNVRALQRTAVVMNSAGSAQIRALGTSYAGLNGLETHDVITWVDDKTVSFSLNSINGNADMFSVITAVPEAPTWAMLITGFGLVGLGSRRRRATSVAA